MEKPLDKIIAKELRNIADMFDAGNSNLSEEQQCDVLSVLVHTSMSAEEVCDYLHISRATLTNYIRDGVIPKGRKVRYRTGLVWFKDELIKTMRC